MIKYDINQGVKKLKTKTQRTLSTLSIGVASLGLVLAMAPGLASADSNVSDFEPSTYSLGNINGQDGWSKTGAYDSEVVNNIYGFSSFGTQTLRISNGVASGSFGDQTFSKPLVNEAGETDAFNNGYSGGTRQPHFEAQFDIASTSPSQQSGLFLSVSPDRGDGARMSYLGFDDQADGIHVIFYDVQGTDNPANFVGTDIATISRASHAIKFSMDLLDGPSNDVVKIYIDGNLVHTGTSWENYYRFDPESNPGLAYNNSRTVDSLLFRAGGSSVPGNLGGGYLFDNVTLLSGPIPVTNPTNKDQCKKNGWKDYGVFKNQGDCVSFVATNGKNQPNGH